jgi:hypothetical protein
VEHLKCGTTQDTARDPGWRVYQPSWPEALAYSFGLCGIFGAFSYYRTGNVVALGLALVLAVPVCAFVRWIYPMFKHLVWGDPE